MHPHTGTQFALQEPKLLTFCSIIKALSRTYIIIEIAIQTQNVGVSQVRLDLHLSAQLVLYVGVTQLILEQHLQQ